VPGLLAVLFATACAAATTVSSASGQGAPPVQADRVAASEKDARTPAQQKIDSRLLYEIYRVRGEAEARSVPPGPTGVRLDRRGRALVDIRADVTPALLALVRKTGATIVSTSARHRSIIARVPLLQLEPLADNPGVRAISPAAEAATVR
jgi:hypothetical protein